MFNVKLTVNIKNLENFDKLKNDIEKQLIGYGLDYTINKSLKELKIQLKSFINNDVKAPVPKKSVKARFLDNTLDSLELPKTDQDLMKYLTGVDIRKIRSTGDYTTSVDAKAVVVNDNRVRLRFPISDTESFEENHMKAVNFFSSSLFIMSNGNGTVSYYQNPGFDLSQYIKVVCSTDVGETDKSKKKYNAYKNSQKMTAQKDDMGRYAQWTLKQEAIKKITDPNSGFINISNVISDIKSGDFETALANLKQANIGSRFSELEEKIHNLENRTDLSPEMTAYTNILDLINNIAIDKESGKFGQTVGSVYNLVSSHSQDDKKLNKFTDMIYNQINIWIIENSPKWFEDFVKVAERILKKY